MKRLLLPAFVLLVLAACATGGGGGGVGVYTDCYTDYCAEYDDSGLQRLYLRTPGTPVAARGRVTTAARHGGTQVVTRNPGSAASARMTPIVSARPAAPSPAGGRKP